MNHQNHSEHKTAPTKQTLEQCRAQDAWTYANEAKVKLGDDFDKYVNLAKSVPALIMNSGLMQVMAFLHEKSLDKKTGRPKPNDPHTWMGNHLRKAIHQRFPSLPEDFAGMMEKLMSSDSRQFQDITTEAFAWLKWLRQMAAARNGGN